MGARDHTHMLVTHLYVLFGYKSVIVSVCLTDFDILADYSNKWPSVWSFLFDDFRSEQVNFIIELYIYIKTGKDLLMYILHDMSE